MPDGSLPILPETGSLTRHDRPAATAFLADAAAEAAIRDALASLIPGLELRRGGIRAAIAAQKAAPSPRILIVDVLGEPDPVALLGQLSTVVEPDTCVLVVGELNDLSLYREITRGLGAADYLARPLTRDVVARHFGPVVAGQAPDADMTAAAPLITVTGVRGGVGASVIAAGLATHLAATARRHTVLLDADLLRGTAALLLDVEAGEGLRTALASPERIDALLAERAASPVTDRLQVLAARDAGPDSYATGACEHLLAALRRRYNVILADTPWTPGPFTADLLAAARHRVLVLTPTLPGIRDAQRLLALPGPGPARTPATVVLNRANMHGGLKRTQIEAALRHPVDVVIPDLPRVVTQSVTLGQPAKALREPIASILSHIGSLRAPGAPAAAAPPRRFWQRSPK